MMTCETSLSFCAASTVETQTVVFGEPPEVLEQHHLLKSHHFHSHSHSQTPLPSFQTLAERHKRPNNPQTFWQRRLKPSFRHKIGQPTFPTKTRNTNVVLECTGTLTGATTSQHEGYLIGLISPHDAQKVVSLVGVSGAIQTRVSKIFNRRGEPCKDTHDSHSLARGHRQHSSHNTQLCRWHRGCSR